MKRLYKYILNNIKDKTTVNNKMATTNNSRKTLNDILEAGTNTLVVNKKLTHEAMLPYITEIEKNWARTDEFYRPKEECGKCCLCKGFLNSKWGNNPAPLRKRGKCCDACNMDKVIPARMSGFAIDFGTGEEQILQRKVMDLMGDKSGNLWYWGYEPFNIVKARWFELCVERGVKPIFDPTRKCIAYEDIKIALMEDFRKANISIGEIPIP